MTAILLTALALADPAPTELVQGQDVTDWAELVEGSPTPAELQAFILEYPTSTLAELAWDALRLEPEATAFARRHRALVQTLERSRIAHAERLAMPPAAWVPAPLEIDAGAETPDEEEPEDPPPVWRLHGQLGAAVDDAGVAGALGLGFGRTWWTVLLRGQLGQALNAEAALRIQPTSFGVLMVEAGADARARGIGRLGVSIPVTQRIHLETSMALAVGQLGIDPVIRLELSGRVPLKRAR